MTPKIGVWILAAGLGLATQPARAAETDVSSAIKDKAEAGDSDAQLTLGLAAEANEEKPDFETAARWYRQASEGGSGKADWHLGILHETGEGVEQSYEDARVCYERAVSRGVEAANMRLGILYLEGWGVTKDRKKAAALITRAAESGHVPAMTMLSGMYFAGIGVDKSTHQALAWAERAAALDDREGQVMAGQLAMKRRSEKPDVKIAREWFQLSAEQEYASAMLAMAGTFMNKKGATADERETGKRWMELALENESAEAGFLLAIWEFTSPAGMTKEAETRARDFLRRSERLGCMAASEVFELEKLGKPLREALRYVATTPTEVRYVELSARRASEDDVRNHPPRVVKAVKPVYPAGLKLSGQQGMVKIQFVVDSRGIVQEPTIVEATHPGFVDSALQAIRQFRFEPGVKDGRIVSTRMQIPVYFQLKIPVTRSSETKPVTSGTGAGG